MKKILGILFACVSFISCNDGDIIVTSFDFDNQNLQACGGPGAYVFFKINTSTQESISLKLNTTDVLFLESGTVNYSLNESNFVNYRKFGEGISTDYFCSSIPPISPLAQQNYLANSGTASLTTITTLEDNDNVDEQINTTDTDEDGLLNYYDFDDDGDNIPTSAELGDDPSNPRDSDGDGIADYLDDDDDNDSVLTRNEDLNSNLNPLDDITDPTVGPDYLNSNISNETTINEYILHTYALSSDIGLILQNLVLFNDEEQLIIELIDLGMLPNILQGTVPVTPIFN
ncbi:hypothetical protein N8252_04080 [Ulvibacter sp.]|nr:hypothetical protein [Ulvibacter sp.]MDC1327485.1 hypothetical protein [Ulvibacter sp.]